MMCAPSNRVVRLPAGNGICAPWKSAVKKSSAFSARQYSVDSDARGPENHGMDSSIAIAIVGAGAMGSAFAFLIGRTDRRVILLERDARVVSAVAGGLIVHDGECRETIRPEIGSDPAIIRDADPVFIFVKCHSTEAAMDDIAPAIGTATMVSLQNGIGNRELIARHVGEDAIVYGSVVLGATMIAPGEVSLRGGGSVVIGGRDARRVEDVRRLLARAGLAVSVTDDPERAVWDKAIVNAAINPLGALLGVPNGVIAADPHAARIQEEVVREAVAVANGMGIGADPDALLASVRDVCRITASNRCSMLQDLDDGRATEIDGINGAIVRIGKELGIATPWNDELACLIRARERLGTPGGRCEP